MILRNLLRNLNTKIYDNSFLSGYYYPLKNDLKNYNSSVVNDLIVPTYSAPVSPDYGVRLADNLIIINSWEIPMEFTYAAKLNYFYGKGGGSLLRTKYNGWYGTGLELGHYVDTNNVLSISFSWGGWNPPSYSGTYQLTDLTDWVNFVFTRNSEGLIQVYVNDTKIIEVVNETTGWTCPPCLGFYANNNGKYPGDFIIRDIIANNKYTPPSEIHKLSTFTSYTEEDLIYMAENTQSIYH